MAKVYRNRPMQGSCDDHASHYGQQRRRGGDVRAPGRPRLRPRSHHDEVVFRVHVAKSDDARFDFIAHSRLRPASRSGEEYRGRRAEGRRAPSHHRRRPPFERQDDPFPDGSTGRRSNALSARTLRLRAQSRRRLPQERAHRLGSSSRRRHRQSVACREGAEGDGRRTARPAAVCAMWCRKY